VQCINLVVVGAFDELNALLGRCYSIEYETHTRNEPQKYTHTETTTRCGVCVRVRCAGVCVSAVCIALPDRPARITSSALGTATVASHQKGFPKKN